MTKLKRKQLKLHPEVYFKLEKYKDKIHDFASKKRVPMSWNEFFMIIINDYWDSRSKCHCGKFYDCDHCRMFDEISRRR
jgi:hypothetical protein